MVRLATFYDPDGNTFMLAQRLDSVRGAAEAPFSGAPGTAGA